MKPRTTPKLVLLPRTARARKTYTDLRNLGFPPAYALDVANALEHTNNNFSRWALVQRVLREDPEGAREWLKARGY